MRLRRLPQPYHEYPDSTAQKVIDSLDNKFEFVSPQPRTYAGVVSTPVSEETVTSAPGASGHLDFIHQVSDQLASADRFHEVLDQIVELMKSIVSADSCFIYVLEGKDLVLRASQNPHPEAIRQLTIPLGEGMTGWVAQKCETVAISGGAMRDPRFRNFRQLPEDGFEAFLSVPVLAGGRLVGVLNLQHVEKHEYSQEEVRLAATVGYLVGSEIERARLDSEVADLTDKLETRKLVERAKGILQRDLGLTEEEAYLRLQRESRSRRTAMKQVAEAVVLSDDLRRAQSN